MAKKVVKKKVSKKKVSSKRVPAKSVALKKPTSVGKSKLGVSVKSKIRTSLNSLAFFGILFLISIISYGAVSSEIYKQLFFLCSLAFASISVALILVVLIYFFYSKIKLA